MKPLDEATTIQDLLRLFTENESLDIPPLLKQHWWIVVTALQVAVRHPSLTPTQLQQIAMVGRRIQLFFAPHLTQPLQTLLERGWDASYDGIDPSIVDQVISDLNMEEEIPESGTLPAHLRAEFGVFITEHPDIELLLAPFEAFQVICALQSAVQGSDIGTNSLEGSAIVTAAHRLTRELELSDDLYHFIQQRWAPELQDSDDDPLIPTRFFKEGPEP